MYASVDILCIFLCGNTIVLIEWEYSTIAFFFLVVLLLPDIVLHSNTNNFLLRHYSHRCLYPLSFQYFLLLNSGSWWRSNRQMCWTTAGSCDWQDLPFKKLPPGEWGDFCPTYYTFWRHIWEGSIDVHLVTFCFVSYHRKTKGPKKQFLVYGASRNRSEHLSSF